MKNIYVPVDTLKSFVTVLFEKAGSNKAESAIIAEHLVEANLAGHDSHGVLRVPAYIGWLRDGLVCLNQNLSTVSQNGPFVVADGNFGFGQVIGEQAAALGISLASDHGVSIVGLRNSGHLGRIGDFALQAAQAGLISIHFVNTNGFGILVAPFGGTDARLSTNPIAIGIPRDNGEHVILDMATSVFAEGKIRAALNSGRMLPEGVLLNNRGTQTRDPQDLYADPPGALLPLGGYKGHCLSIICEILAGSLTGSGASNPQNPTIKRMVNGMLSIYFSPRFFVNKNEFETDINALVAWITGSPNTISEEKILMPGEIENKTKKIRLLNGIPLDRVTKNQLVATASLVGLTEEDFKFLVS